MARALYFTLFCVFQVMSAVTHVLAAPHNLTPTETFIPPIMGAKLSPTDERDHDKRSLNIWPYDEKYLSTTHYTMEILKDGTVRASRALKPEWGVLRIFTACLAVSNLSGSHMGHNNITRQNSKNSGKVSIRGSKADKYVCMNAEGEVYASEKCTDECEFKQDKIGDGSKFRYYSLKYRGFKTDPKRTKKRWYLGLKRGEVLKGHETKKRKDYVQLMLRPVDSDNKASKYVFPTTPSIDNSDSDKNGGVIVLTTTTSPNRNTKKPRRTKPTRKTPRRCQDNDPLDLFRFADCGKRDRKTRRRGQSPFSTPHIRHGDKKSNRGVESRRQPINLFSIPNR